MTTIVLTTIPIYRRRKQVLLADTQRRKFYRWQQPHHVCKVPVIETLTIFDPKRERQTRRKVQPYGSLPSLPIHDGTQGEPGDIRVREDDEDCHCIIEGMKG
jgi:hypothetical protein